MDLDTWLAKLKQATSHAEVFGILDEFRKFDWTDEQRSKVSKLYMRMLQNIAPPAENSAAPAAAAVIGVAAGAGAIVGKGQTSTSATNAAGTTSGTGTKDLQSGQNPALSGTANESDSDTGEPEEVWYEKM